ncbi:MAG: hypothetical protein ACK2UH_13475 [Candidatus Promineifilaceae bacterium]
MTQLLDLLNLDFELAPARPAQGLPRLAAIFQALNEAGVRYCHWKSNVRLAESLDGQTDLDLLIWREDAAAFRAILAAHDVRPTLAAPGKEYPGLENFLGYDPGDGCIFHLHAHYQLVLGEQYVKNYRLPLERAFVDSARPYMGVRVPAPALEVSILALRALLKYRQRDAFLALVWRDDRGGLPAAIVDEFRFLLAQCERAAVIQVLEQQAPFLPAATIVELLDAVSRGRISPRRLLALRGQVLAALKPFQRTGRWRARWRYYRAAAAESRPVKRLRRLQRRPKARQTPASGGLALAIVGVDGAGKSTVVDEMVRRLGKRLSVRVYYLGSSQPGLLTGTLKQAARLLDKLHAGARRLPKQGYPLARLAWSGRMFFKNLSYVAVGRDRRRRYLAGQRAAANGAIVIFDRYPLPQLSVSGRPADGPRIAHANPAPRGRLTNWLSALEQRAYRQIAPPENLIVLQISPEISLARKPGHRREEIEAKCLAMQQIQAGRSRVIEIDAQRPLPLVLTEVQRSIWQLL